MALWDALIANLWLKPCLFFVFFFFTLLKKYLCMCVGVFLACMCHMCAVLRESRRGRQIPRPGVYRWLQAALWVLGIEFGFSGSSVSQSLSLVFKLIRYNLAPCSTGPTIVTEYPVCPFTHPCCAFQSLCLDD